MKWSQMGLTVAIVEVILLKVLNQYKMWVKGNRLRHLEKLYENISNMPFSRFRHVYFCLWLREK